MTTTESGTKPSAKGSAAGKNGKNAKGGSKKKLIIVAVLAWAVRRTDPRAPESTAVITFGVVLMVTTPVYSWYALLLLALIAMTGRIAWLPMVAGAALNMVGATLVPHHVVAMHTVCYASATVVTLILLRILPAPATAAPTAAQPSAAT